MDYHKLGSISTGTFTSYYAFLPCRSCKVLVFMGYHITTRLNILPCKCSCSDAAVATTLPLEYTAWLVCAYERTYCHLLSIFSIAVDWKWPCDQLTKPLHAAVCKHCQHSDLSQLIWSNSSPLLPDQYCCCCSWQLKLGAAICVLSLTKLHPPPGYGCGLMSTYVLVGTIVQEIDCNDFGRYLYS